MNANRQSPDLLNVVRSLSRQVHDLIFPPACLGCESMGAWLCPRCAQRVEPVGNRICRRCGRAQTAASDICRHCVDTDLFPLTQVRAAAYHQSPLREAIHAFKYDSRTELSAPLARYLIAAYGDPCWRPPLAQIDLVVPVPLHADRRRERGYNQAELLAADFCRGVGLPMDPSAMQRDRHTPHQVGLNAEERRDNVADAFAAAWPVANKRILLIDDVYTTGATLNACAGAALLAGAAAVYALTLAVPRATFQ